MNNVLITGASGFFGRNILSRVEGMGDVRVFALSRNAISDHAENITFIRSDVLEQNTYKHVFEEHDINCVIHLAAITEHNAVVSDKVNTLMTNLRGTHNVLELFNKYCRGSQFIYASTGKVYGNTNEMPISEKAVCCPTSVLGKSKYMTEQLIDYCKEPNNKYLVCRIFNVFGPGQKPNFVFPTILSQIDNREIMLGNITDKRDYLFLDDLIDAVICCVRSRDNFSDFDVVNIGSGEPYSVEDIVGMISELLNKKIHIHVEDSRIRKDETAVEYCDNSKLKKATGWKRRYSMYDGIKSLLLSEGLLSGI